jgi:RNA recognition motif-containing protein
VWPIFVGNIAFETREEDVIEIFQSTPGLKSFRLASLPNDGGSRGFGFAEFDDPSAALKAIQVHDGAEIQGRRLRLRWGESAPTTPEVDEFHRSAERYKTRPCFEAFRGTKCPRGFDCPYAHSDAEMRHPGEGAPMKSPRSTTLPVVELGTSESVKVAVPFASFPGSTDEERQRAAYNAVLGVGLHTSAL